jgi:hypothetical protein
VGAGARGIFNNEIDQKFANGLRGDIGMRYTPQGNWRAGLALQNLSLTGSDTLRPLRLRPGVGYTFRQWQRPLALDLNSDWQVNDKEPMAWKGSLEWAAMRRLILRGGWTLANQRTPHGPSLGAGWIFGIVELDYAYYTAGDLGRSHLVSMRVIP